MSYMRFLLRATNINLDKGRWYSTLVNTKYNKNEYNFMKHVKLYWKSSESLHKKNSVKIVISPLKTKDSNYLDPILLMRLYGIRSPVYKRNNL